VYKERGEILLLRFAQALEEQGKGRTDAAPGRKKECFLLIAPKGKEIIL